MNEASFWGHPVSAEVQTIIETPREKAFAQIVPIDLPSIFRGLWPIPAVIGTRDQSGAWDRAGQSRTVLLSDNSTAQEVLLEVTPATHFSYRVEKFTGTLGGLAAHANGEWWFEQNGQSGQTVVRWRYEFIPKSKCCAVALKALVALFWKRYMIKALSAAKALVESDGMGTPIRSAPG